MIRSADAGASRPPFHPSSLCLRTDLYKRRPARNVQVVEQLEAPALHEVLAGGTPWLPRPRLEVVIHPGLAEEPAEVAGFRHGPWVKGRGP